MSRWIERTQPKPPIDERHDYRWPTLAPTVRSIIWRREMIGALGLALIVLVALLGFWIETGA